MGVFVLYYYSHGSLEKTCLLLSLICRISYTYCATAIDRSKEIIIVGGPRIHLRLVFYVRPTCARLVM